MLSNKITALIRKIDSKYLSAKFESKKPILSVELTNRLNDIYKEDIEKLQNYIGKDLGHWNLS